MAQSCANQVTFQEASAYFSEEEWTLLQEWQKELYKNVMKEIHQALISLGPLITTTVCSLRAKEKEEPWPINNKYSERKHMIPYSPRDDAMANPDMLYKMNNEETLDLNIPHASDGREISDCITTGDDAMANPDMLYKMNNEETLDLNIPHASDGREISDCISTGYPFHSTDTNILVRKEEELAYKCFDPLEGEIGECSINHNPEYEVVSFQIKDEEDIYTTRRIGDIRIPIAGGITTNRRHKVRHSVIPSGKAILEEASSGRPKGKTIQNYEAAAQSRSNQSSSIKMDVGEKDITQKESDLGNMTHLSYPTDISTSQIESNTSHGSNLHPGNPLTCQQNLQKSSSLYTCNECGKTFIKKKYLTEHKSTHMGVRPFKCTECEKSFRRKYGLLVHRRTHTGERPYQCMICQRSFNQMGALNRHKRAHIGERPYHCHQCGKSFGQNVNLITHQRTNHHLKIVSSLQK